MQSCHRRSFLQSFIIALLIIIIPIGCGIMMSCRAENTFHHLVILGDPHLPGRNIEQKEQVLAKINSWDDVEMVVAIGDMR